jgi:hypothetical protein
MNGIALKPQSRETRIEVVLDLTKKVTYTTIPAAANGEKVALTVEDVTGLDTPYEIQPSQGVLQAGQPVDIVLKDYPNIKFHLSLAGGGNVVEVAPKIDLGQGKTMAFTKKWCKQARVTLERELANVTQQLQAAEAAATSIETWLASPVLKPAQLRSIKKEQLLILKKQTIPALEQQMKDAQTRADASQRLCQLIEKIHGTASIQLVIEDKANDTGQSKDD